VMAAPASLLGCRSYAELVPSGQVGYGTGCSESFCGHHASHGSDLDKLSTQVRKTLALTPMKRGMVLAFAADERVGRNSIRFLFVRSADFGRTVDGIRWGGGRPAAKRCLHSRWLDTHRFFQT
jgi:hypothetical protein